MSKVDSILGATAISQTKGETNTINLWEGYKEQAIFWRLLALLQIPSTALACILALYFAMNRQNVINVPTKPLPGFYAANEIPDDEFVNRATEYLNLVATYQSSNARPQFIKAAEMVQEPMLTQFREEILDTELRTIESTNRTQIFFVDPSKTLVRRLNRKQVLVYLMGERTKFIAGRQLDTTSTVYKITLTTIPRNALNDYGITVTSVEIEPSVKSVADYHRKILKEEKKQKRGKK